MITSLPNLLTLSRIAFIPLIVVLFFVDGDAARWAACTLFAAAAITDYFDGYFARARQQVSKLGRFLDPVADKLLVVTLIVMLVAFNRMSLITVLPAIIIVCREIIVSGLREFLASLQISLPVTNLAKWKTTIQFFALGFLIVGDAGPDFLPVRLIGEIGLWLAAAMTFITGFDYMRASAPYMTEDEPPKDGKEAKSVG